MINMNRDYLLDALVIPTSRFCSIELPSVDSSVVDGAFDGAFGRGFDRHHV